MWSLDDWKYLERQVVTDPKSRTWTVALMDVLGQEGDPDRPNDLVALQYTQGRYFTLIYNASGGMQWERGYPSLPQATIAYERLVAAVSDGRIDPARPVYREDLEDS
jgi:hypothetical protein